jgi:hypothetical protein
MIEMEEKMRSYEEWKEEIEMGAKRYEDMSVEELKALVNKYNREADALLKKLERREGDTVVLMRKIQNIRIRQSWVLYELGRRTMPKEKFNEFVGKMIDYLMQQEMRILFTQKVLGGP